MTPALEICNLSTHFTPRRGLLRSHAGTTIRAVDGVNLSVAPNEVLGLVGESGCGKSTLARTVVQLESPTAGEIRINGADITQLSTAGAKQLCIELQMVFQDPYASLNPRMTVYDALSEPLLVHRIVPRSAIAGRVMSLMDSVGLAARFVRKYPHEFSGGQRQRIAIARALAVEPSVLIADEPVSALDVSVQAQILNLLAELVQHRRLAMLFISHDLSVVRHISDRIAVMYQGKIVETGPAESVYTSPTHPYTQKLLDAIPCLSNRS